MRLIGQARDRPATIRFRRRMVMLSAAALSLFAVLSAGSLLLTVTAPAGADHRFSDIGTGTFFHASTGWLAEHEIADGFANGTFRPNDQITRGQASYWFANYNETLVMRDGQATAFPAKSAHTDEAICRPDERAVGGGGTTNRDNLFMTDSEPIDTVNGPGTGWQIRWQFPDGASQTATIDTWAFCMPVATP